MALADGRTGVDADDDVREVTAACLTHPQTPQLDGRIEPAIAAAAASCAAAGLRSIRTSTLRRIKRAAASSTSAATKSAAIASARGCLGRGDQADEHRDRPGHVGAEVERVRRSASLP